MGGVRIALSIVLLSVLSLGAEKIRIASYNFENYLVMDRIVREVEAQLPQTHKGKAGFAYLGQLGQAGRSGDSGNRRPSLSQ